MSNLAAKATHRESIGLAVISLPCLVYAIDLTVLDLAIPATSAELWLSALQLLRIIDIYGFLVTGFLVTMGTLGGRIGRRKLLPIGAAACPICPRTLRNDAPPRPRALEPADPATKS